MSGLHSARAIDIAEQAAAHFAEPTESGKPRLFIPNMIPRNNNIGFEFGSEEEAFPRVNAGCSPAGNLVLVQIRQPKLRTAGGILIDGEIRKTEFDNTQVAKVVAVGALAFKDRKTLQHWPEGAWCAVGDYVRVPKYQGDTFTKEYERPDFEIDDTTGRRREFTAIDVVHFVNIKDLALLGKYDSLEEALTARSYL